MGEDLVDILVFLASRDVYEGYVHIKFEVSLLETKIVRCPDAQLAISQKTDLIFLPFEMDIRYEMSAEKDESPPGF